MTAIDASPLMREREREVLVVSPHPNSGREGFGVAMANVPFLVLFAGALLLLSTPVADAEDSRLVVVSLVLVLGAVALAGLAGVVSLPFSVALVVPVLELLAVGPLRATTGGGASLFTALVVPPVIAMAADRRRRGVVLAVVGTSVVLVVPQLLAGMVTTVSDVLRAVITPAALGVAAFTVHELTRRLTSRVATVGRLQSEQQVLLARVSDRAVELEDLSRRVAVAHDSLSSVVEAVTEQAIVSCDLTGLITVWNPGAERLLGARRARVVGRRNVTALYRPEELIEGTVGGLHRSALDVVVAGAVTEGSSVRDWTWVCDGGDEVTVEVAVTPRRDGRGALTGYTLVGTDRTAARAAERLREEFTGLISHELRTPLTSILGYLELVLDDPDQTLTEEQKQYLTVVERNAHRLLRLVGDLLFTAQVEAGQFTLQVTDVDLTAIVQGTVDTVQVAAQAAGVSVELDAQAAVVVPGDADRLGQVCDNLLSNAIKFTPRGGRVQVALDTYRRGTELMTALTVTDNGIGIPVSEQDALFTRFFRASTARRHAVPGVGLGLTITQAITTAHRGTMDLHSEPGRGTTFTVVLPAHDRASSGGVSGGEVSGGGVSGGGTARGEGVL